MYIEDLILQYTSEYRIRKDVTKSVTRSECLKVRRAQSRGKTDLVKGPEILM